MNIAQMMEQSHLEEDQMRRDRSHKPDSPNYTGNECPSCKRVRIYECMDNRFRCEKCLYVSEPGQEATPAPL